MITIREARALVLERARRVLPSGLCPSPPRPAASWPRTSSPAATCRPRCVMMDGFAVRAADAAPGARLRVVDEVAAGARRAAVGRARAIMTGAPLPGADAVVPIEWTRSEGGECCWIVRCSRASTSRRGRDHAPARPSRAGGRSRAVAVAAHRRRRGARRWCAGRGWRAHQRQRAGAADAAGARPDPREQWPGAGGAAGADGRGREPGRGAHTREHSPSASSARPARTWSAHRWLVGGQKFAWPDRGARRAAGLQPHLDQARQPTLFHERDGQLYLPPGNPWPRS